MAGTYVHMHVHMLQTGVRVQGKRIVHWTASHVLMAWSHGSSTCCTHCQNKSFGRNKLQHRQAVAQSHSPVH